MVGDTLVETDEAWQDYLHRLPVEHVHRQVKPDAFAFGDGALADELAQLVIAGKKRATASLAIEYTACGESLPKVGDISIILRGDGVPVAIIERTEVKIVPFQDVDADFAATEGEGDGSLASWREAHVQYFNTVCERLGGVFNETTPVICQVFRVVWQVAA
jgi:uncharacterized protein YhfF